VTDGPRATLSVVEEPGGRLCLRLGGELDIASLPDIEDGVPALLAREPQPLLIDLPALTFMDSSGVAVLIRIANRFRPVETRNATPAVRRVLESLGLADRFGLDGA